MSDFGIFTGTHIVKYDIHTATVERSFMNELLDMIVLQHDAISGLI